MNGTRVKPWVCINSSWNIMEYHSRVREKKNKNVKCIHGQGQACLWNLSVKHNTQRFTERQTEYRRHSVLLNLRRPVKKITRVCPHVRETITWSFLCGFPLNIWCLTNHGLHLLKLDLHWFCTPGNEDTEFWTSSRSSPICEQNPKIRKLLHLGQDHYTHRERTNYLLFIYIPNRRNPIGFTG